MFRGVSTLPLLFIIMLAPDLGPSGAGGRRKPALSALAGPVKCLTGGVRSFVRSRPLVALAVAASVFGGFFYSAHADRQARRGPDGSPRRIDLAGLTRAIEDRGVSPSEAEVTFLAGATEAQRWRVFKHGVTTAFSLTVAALGGDACARVASDAEVRELLVEHQRHCIYSEDLRVVIDFALGRNVALPAPRDFPVACGARCTAALRKSFAPVQVNMQEKCEDGVNSRAVVLSLLSRASTHQPMCICMRCAARV